jgi:transcription elongation factor Elf1
MSESTKKLTRVCRCQNCGNEAEMMVTCSLEDLEQPPTAQPSTTGEKTGKVKGTATCSHCGNEADMWIDL